MPSKMLSFDHRHAQPTKKHEAEPVSYTGAAAKKEQAWKERGGVDGREALCLKQKRQCPELPTDQAD